ncbi:hypothetical protein [Microbacterium candidum]|uniref:Uncharacterized protein n=1 Tax=Microbacterium candidum TaxID=3041922 RepID=A0ABT7MUH9_9MICO|nr:hypothetical protein [Microbacterium sp. ASV49]MDL9978116.1 hypothetical protein [Microbacterium sp. ASV49]
MSRQWVWWVLGAIGLVLVAIPAVLLTIGSVWATADHTAAATRICASLAGASHLDAVTWESGLSPHWTCEWSNDAARTAGSANIRWYEILR